METLSQKRNLFILSFIISLVLIAGSVTLSHAAGLTCPDGSSGTLATQAQADSASPAGSIVAGTTYVCPNDSRLGVSNSVGSSKDYLKSLGSGSATTQAANFTMLNDTFAVCAANFLKAYQQKYTSVKITSAGRTAAQQLEVCPVAIPGKCGGSGSNHIKGLALDVVPSNQNYSQMWAFARSNPQFGVCFPFEMGDRVHMILQGIPGSGEAASCVSKGYGNKPCSGAPVTNYNTPTTPQSPTSQLTSALCSLTGSCASQQVVCQTGFVADSSGNCVQQTTTQCPQGSVFSNGTCYAIAGQTSTPQPTTSTGSTGSSGSSGTTGTTASTGSTGTTGTTASTASTATTAGTTGTTATTVNPISSLLTNTSTNSVTATSTGTSTADLLNYYMNLVSNPSATTASSTTTSTTTPITLNGDTTDVATLLANEQANQPTVTYTSTGSDVSGSNGTSTTATTITTQTTSGDTIVTIQPTSTSGQTFTSSDLNNSNTAGNTTSSYTPTSVSFAQQTLQKLSGILQQILGFLTPFNGAVQTPSANE